MGLVQPPPRRREGRRVAHPGQLGDRRLDLLARVGVRVGPDVERAAVHVAIEPAPDHRLGHRRVGLLVLQDRENPRVVEHRHRPRRDLAELPDKARSRPDLQARGEQRGVGKKAAAPGGRRRHEAETRPLGLGDREPKGVPALGGDHVGEAAKPDPHARRQHRLFSDDPVAQLAVHPEHRHPRPIEQLWLRVEGGQIKARVRRAGHKAGQEQARLVLPQVKARRGQHVACVQAEGKDRVPHRAVEQRAGQDLGHPPVGQPEPEGQKQPRRHLARGVREGDHRRGRPGARGGRERLDRRVEQAAQEARRHHPVGLEAGEGAAHKGRPQRRHQRGHRPEPEDRLQADRQINPHGQHDRDALPCLDAGRDPGRGEGVGAHVERVVGEPLPAAEGLAADEGGAAPAEVSGDAILIEIVAIARAALEDRVAPRAQVGVARLGKAPGGGVGDRQPALHPGPGRLAPAQGRGDGPQIKPVGVDRRRGALARHASGAAPGPARSACDRDRCTPRPAAACGAAGAS